MHRLRPSAIAERFRPRVILAGGGAATVVVLLLAIPLTGLWDLGAGAGALATAAATGALWRESRRLRSLPLEVAPVALTGVVDGAVVYRFRARLGRGRPFRDPIAEVVFEPAHGDPFPLPTGPLPASLTGPLTVIVRDPGGHVRPPGAFRITLRVVSAGRTWHAAARVPLEAVETGRFDGIALVAGRVAFDDRWRDPRPEAR